MAERPIFRWLDQPPFVREIRIEFRWHPGLSRFQARRSLAELHGAADVLGHGPVLDVSTKSPDPLGAAASAFRQLVTLPSSGLETSIESAFQGSKVFSGGGPYRDIYELHGRDAKRDPRLQESGELEAFDYDGERWPLLPRTAFYDWLYLQAIAAQPRLLDHAASHAAFSDISFNPKRSLNCQARALARGIGLRAAGRLDEALADREAFVRLAYQGEVEG